MKNILKNNKNKEKKEDNSKIRTIKFNILAIAAIILFCAVLAPITLQNDTFYTIRIGEHILQTKTIDMQDPFSWHENLPYTYPHWAYDVMIYLIYHLGGFTGIFISTIIFSCILGIVIYFTNKKISKNSLVSLIITLGAMYLLKDYIAARAQLVTFILFELTILFIEKFLETKKIRYGIGIIIIAILIANLHCAVWPFLFVLFLPYIAEYICNIDVRKIYYKLANKYYNKKLKTCEKNKTKYAKSKEELNKNQKQIEKINEKIKQNEEKLQTHLEVREKRRKKPYKIKMVKIDAVKWLIVIMIICAFTGLLTPLKNTPYTYLYNTMKGNTTQSISEHLPLTLINNKPIMIVLCAIIAILVFTDVKIRLKDIFFLGGLGLLMFMTRRQVSMFVLFGSGIVAKLVADLFEKYDKNGTKEIEDIMLSTLGTIATILVIALFMVLQIRLKIGDKYINEKSYPVEACKYIKENLNIKQIRLFNEYNYGSYLLFEGIPVFIDSRADLYAPEFNKTKDYPEGRNIFSDYINTSNISRYYEKTFDEYNITHVILYKNSKLKMLLSKDSNYKELYSDDNFIIYERNKKY